MFVYSSKHIVSGISSPKRKDCVLVQFCYSQYWYCRTHLKDNGMLYAKFCGLLNWLRLSLTYFRTNHSLESISEIPVLKLCLSEDNLLLLLVRKLFHCWRWSDVGDSVAAANVHGFYCSGIEAYFVLLQCSTYFYYYYNVFEVSGVSDFVFGKKIWCGCFNPYFG